MVKSINLQYLRLEARNKKKQAGAELGQAQLKLELDFNSIIWIKPVLLYLMSRPTFPLTPI